jgi:hypothetical protein
MPSQADEEAHQLSYLQKHMANVLTLLADSVDGEGDESMVSIKTFQYFSLQEISLFYVTVNYLLFSVNNINAL